MSEAAQTQVSGISSMSEGNIINKYTLVPVGLVVAAILATAAVVNVWGSESERISILEVQAIQASKERAALSVKLDAANNALIRIQVKLGVDLTNP